MLRRTAWLLVVLCYSSSALAIPQFILPSRIELNVGQSIDVPIRVIGGDLIQGMDLFIGSSSPYFSVSNLRIDQFSPGANPADNLLFYANTSNSASAPAIWYESSADWPSIAVGYVATAEGSIPADGIVAIVTVTCHMFFKPETLSTDLPGYATSTFAGIEAIHASCELLEVPEPASALLVCFAASLALSRHTRRKAA